MEISFKKFKSLLGDSAFIIMNGMTCEVDDEGDKIVIYYQNEPSALHLKIEKDTKIIFIDNCFNIERHAVNFAKIYLADFKKMS